MSCFGGRGGNEVEVDTKRNLDEESTGHYTSVDDSSEVPTFQCLSSLLYIPLYFFLSFTFFFVFS